jgi:universal stress protein A
MKIKPVQNRGGVRVELGPEEAQLPAASHETKPPGPSVFKLKEILVPVDFTACSLKALAYAVPIAKQLGATLTLLHVVEPTYMAAADMGVVVDVETEDDVRKEMEKLRRRFADQVRCQPIIRNGSAESEIINVAKELASDLIILSTHGRTGLERLLLGSTVEKVVRRAGCPILIVRPHEHDFVASDASAWEFDDEDEEEELESVMKAGM